MQPNIQFLKKGFTDATDSLIQEVEALDQLIHAYASQLHRAQPLFSGRVIVRYSARNKVYLLGQQFHDIEPGVGKMFKTRTGKWAFAWLKKVDLENLHELRVGKGLRWDTPVKNILKALGVLLLRREAVIGEIKSIRTRCVKSRQGLEFLHSKYSSELIEIVSSVDWDWSVDATNLLAMHFQTEKDQNVLGSTI
jgi:hypothetical protein